MNFTKLILLLTTTLTLSACTPTDLLNFFKQNSPNQDNQPQTIQELQAEGLKLAEAIQSGKPIKCSFTKTDGSEKMEYIVKGKKIKFVGSNISQSGDEGIMVNDGEFMYIWGVKDKQGVKFKIPSPEEAQKTQEQVDKLAQNIPDFSNDKVVSTYENQGFQIDCKQTQISDGEFQIPEDINFQDFTDISQRIKGIQDQFEDIPEASATPELDLQTLDPEVLEQLKNLENQLGDN